MTSAIYNEIEAYPAAWMRNLINAGHIAPGVVDERSILDLQPEDVNGAAQAHFFAGIGVWSHALRLAGWPDDRPVWTGSCPCQPFSTAGKGRGFDDVRHLWPEWFRLIRECRPPVVFGEQVASPAGLGWFDAVRVDLEGEGYAVGVADLCAASVGAPHIRQRLYFVAVSGGELAARVGGTVASRQPDPHGLSGQLAISGGQRLEGLGVQLPERQPRRGMPEASWRCTARELDNTSSARGGRSAGAVPGEKEEGESERRETRRLVDLSGAPSPTRGLWAYADWILCRDGKSRPVEPGTFPLAHGAPARMGRLRAYGNAIVPQVAAAFIASVMEAIS